MLLEEHLRLIATGSRDAENAQQSSDIIVINNACISKVSLTYFKGGARKTLPLKTKFPFQTSRQKQKTMSKNLVC